MMHITPDVLLNTESRHYELGWSVIPPLKEGRLSFAETYMNESATILRHYVRQHPSIDLDLENAQEANEGRLLFIRGSYTRKLEENGMNAMFGHPFRPGLVKGLDPLIVQDKVILFCIDRNLKNPTVRLYAYYDTRDAGTLSFALPQARVINAVGEIALDDAEHRERHREGVIRYCKALAAHLFEYYNLHRHYISQGDHRITFEELKLPGFEIVEPEVYRPVDFDGPDEEPDMFDVNDWPANDNPRYNPF